MIKSLETLTAACLTFQNEMSSYMSTNVFLYKIIKEIPSVDLSRPNSSVSNLNKIIFWQRLIVNNRKCTFLLNSTLGHKSYQKKIKKHS